MDGFFETFLRLEAAERELVLAEDAFSRCLYRYLVGDGPAPSARVTADVLAKRSEAAHALRELRTALERCRRSIRLL